MHNLPDLVDTAPMPMPLAINCGQEEPTWRFIDRQTYAGLTESRNTLPSGAFKDLWNKNTDTAKRLSEATHTYITWIDQLVHQVLLESDVLAPSQKTLGENYLEMQAKAYLNAQVVDHSSFYEILRGDSQLQLVVVGSGFLHHVTQSKDNLLGFVLACLRCLDHFNCTSLQLNRLYLRLNYIKDYTLLIQAKSQF